MTKSTLEKQGEIVKVMTAYQEAGSDPNCLDTKLPMLRRYFEV